MNSTFTEGNLRITINNVVDARKFDLPGSSGHGLAHCMKAVDFIVELPERYLFIEFKDPEDAPPERRHRFVEKLTSGRLDGDLVYKYRDSFLYEWASGRADKPVDFLVLIALDLDKPALSNRTNQLRRRLPLHGPQSKPWPRPIVASCGVFNLRSWNERFPDYPIQRLCASPSP